MNSVIKITGARMHNLKNIDIEIPKGKLTVITGVSGSGKSSLAFDTLYEEGKRRYLMFSNTQFMVDNIPTFESITGLSPTVAVEQRITRQSNPRSTVGTRTKINSMLAALFATFGRSEYNDGEPLSMEMFQKNSPKGMCVRCLGTGKIYTVDEDDLFRNKERTLANLFGNEGKEGKTAHWGGRIHGYCKHVGLSPQQTIESLSEDEFNQFKYGGSGYRPMSDGVVSWVVQFYKWSQKRKHGYWVAQLTCIHHADCPKCGGTGLGEQASHTTINGKTITQLENMYIDDLCEFLRKDRLSNTKLLEEILLKLECLVDVGLHHLALARPIPTLSGGEIQRLFLASYIIAEMDSIIFIFDEPTIGLHEAEKQKLIDIIQNLIKRGNTVVAVEHDANFMQAADYIIDLGPRAGEFGGERIFQGSYSDFMKCTNSLTAPYLSGGLSFPVKKTYNPVNKAKIVRLENCTIHNLRNISVDIPLGLLVGIAGVSGSGKSSLITDTLVPKLKEVLNTVMDEFGYNSEAEEKIVLPEVRITGYEFINKCLIIDQKPIGRTRTSCPATYTGLFDKVRKMFADSPEAKARGFSAGMFSVNGDGNCLKCKGDGVIHYHVGFGNFIHVDCEDCGGTGYRPESLTVEVDGKNIKDILNMSILMAMEYFKDKSKAGYRMLQTLNRVGLGYMTLGQKTPTISGGEAQRIKLAKELGKSGSGKDNVYILDEPTTGLSFSDSEKLIQLMQELVDNGNTVIVTEHDPNILTNCDYIIEMGPGGGSDGGYVLAAGTPAGLRSNEKSIIGRYLK